MTNLELVEIYAEAWRKLDVTILEPYLADDFKYSSFYVFDTLGKEEYLDYLKGKFTAIKASGTEPIVSLGKEGGVLPCVLLQQSGNSLAAITVKVQEGKIVVGYMIPYDLVR